MMNKKLIFNIFLILIFISIIIIFIFLNKNPKLELGVLAVFPKEIDGGSCEFFWNEKDNANKKYAFVNDMALYGYIFVNGKLEKLEMERNKIENEFDYFNEKYELHIEITNTKLDSYENAYMEGILSIVDKNNINITHNIIGYCSY